MDGNDIKTVETRAGESLTGYLKTLYELSASSSNPPAYCLQKNGAGNKTAIHFDAIMDRPNWGDIRARLSRGERCPHRIDALYVKGDEYYFVEFKCDSDVARFANEFCFKFYESFLQLIKHRWISYEEAADHLTYIVVYRGVLKGSLDDIRREFLDKQSQGERDKLKFQMSSPFNCEYLNRPWKYRDRIRPKGGLDILEIMGCHSVLTLNQTQFDKFAAERSWS